MTTYTTIGSVSHATMRNEDLIPAFIDCLDGIKEAISMDQSRSEQERVAEVSRIDDNLSKIEQRMHDDDYYESEEADYDLEHLFDELNNHAPDYCYFGAHPGDGSDYGFWPCEDFRQMVEDDDGLIVDDTSEVPDDYSGIVLHINDHGNATLYSAITGQLTEIWSIC